jgi:hypothetical protein
MSNQQTRNKRSRAMRPGRTRRLVMGLLVLSLVAAGTFLLPAQVSSPGAEAGVVLETHLEQMTGVR